MKKKLATLLILVALAAALASTALAEEYDSASNKFIFTDNSTTTGEKVGGDYLALARSIHLNADVSGDVMAAGGDVTIKNATNQNIYAAGQIVSITVGSAKNIYAGGTSVDVTASDGIGGAYLAATTVTFSGNAVDLYATAGSIEISGTIKENAVIRSDSITFGKDAAVGGTLTIYAAKMPKLPESINQAKVVFHQVRAEQYGGGAFRQLTGIFGFIGLLSAILIAVLITVFKGGFIRENALAFPKKVGWAILWGFVAFIAVPIGSIIAMFTLVGMSAAFILLIVYGIFLGLSPIIAGAVLGRVVFPKLNRFPAAIVGAAAVKLVTYIPVLGTIVFFACAFYVLGIVVMSLKPYREPKTPIPPVMPMQ